MRKRLAVTMLACALAGAMLAGCQGAKGKTASGAAATPAPAPVEGSPSLPSLSAPFPDTTGIFDARLEAAFKSLLGNVTGYCIQQLPLASPKEDVMGCLNSSTIAAIEPSGRAAEHCRDDGNLEKSVQCALVGALLLKVREPSGAGVSANAWQNLEATLGQEMVVVAIDESMACTKEGKREGEAARACYADRLADRFDIAREDGRACLVITDDWDFSQCLGEAAALGIVEAAAKKSALAS